MLQILNDWKLTYSGIEPGSGPSRMIDEIDFALRGGGLLPTLGKRPQGVTGGSQRAAHAHAAALACC